MIDGNTIEKKACFSNSLTQSSTMSHLPFVTFVITVNVLVLLFLLHRAPAPCSDAADRLFYLIGATSCLHIDNHARRALIYSLGTCLEPFSHSLALVASLHLVMLVFCPRLSKCLMGSIQTCGVFYGEGPSIKCMFPWLIYATKKGKHKGCGNILWMQPIGHQYVALRVAHAHYPFSTAFYFHTSLNGRYIKGFFPSKFQKLVNTASLAVWNRK